MNIRDLSQFSYHNLSKEGTGTAADVGENRIVDYPFGQYQIRVLVSPNNEFLGILEIGVSRDFRSTQAKIAGTGFHDVEAYYREE
jgi:hypothetical protein